MILCADIILRPCPNFNGGSLNRRWSQGMDEYLHPKFHMDVITYPCINTGLSSINERAPGVADSSPIN